MSAISTVSTKTTANTFVTATAEDNVATAMGYLSTSLQVGNTSNAKAALEALNKELGVSASAAAAGTAAPFAGKAQANDDYNRLIHDVETQNFARARTTLSRIADETRTHHSGSPQSSVETLSSSITTSSTAVPQPTPITMRLPTGGGDNLKVTV